MSDFHEQLKTIQRRLREQSDAPEIRIDLAQQAIKIADDAKHLPWRLFTRFKLAEESIQIYRWKQEWMIEPYLKAINVFDKAPDAFTESMKGQFLRGLSFAACCMTTFPQYSLAEAEQLFVDLRRIHVAAGYSERASLEAQYHFHLVMGDVTRAAEFLERWQAIPRGEINQCEACDYANGLRYTIALGDIDSIERLAQPILSGKLKCRSVPRSTYFQLLRPYAMAGKLAQADEFYSLAIRHQGDYAHPADLAKQLAYLTFRGKLDEAQELLQSSLAEVRATGMTEDQCNYYRAAFHLVNALIENKPAPQLQFEGSVPVPSDADDAKEWFQQAATTLENLFDERNEHTYYSTRNRDLFAY